MKNWTQQLIGNNSSIKQALSRLNEIGIANNVLFVVDAENILQGSLTDGDIRRGLLGDADINGPVAQIMNRKCRRIYKMDFDNNQLREYRRQGIRSLPVVSADDKILSILDLDTFKNIVPVDALIMAGGKGERLLPLTKEIPKPMLPVGDKPILEHNIDRLVKFGVQHIHISVNYLADQICEHFKNGIDKGVTIKYIREIKPLGTIGSASIAEPFVHDVILLMNSDLLTDIDYADLYQEFVKSKADMAVATIPHHVDLPYAILELQDHTVSSLREKPRYTYFANAGIYLFKKDLLAYLPKGEFYNATDLMEKVIAVGKKLIHFPILGYWLDIGRMADYHKAQEDIKHLNL